MSSEGGTICDSVDCSETFTLVVAFAFPILPFCRLSTAHMERKPQTRRKTTVRRHAVVTDAVWGKGLGN